MKPLLLKVVVQGTSDDPPQKKAKTSPDETTDIDVSNLHQPEDAVPPKASKPTFVCEEGLMDKVKIKTERRLQEKESTDSFDKDNDNGTLNRFSLVVVVRCSREVKTRFLL